MGLYTAIIPMVCVPLLLLWGLYLLFPRLQWDLVKGFRLGIYSALPVATWVHSFYCLEIVNPWESTAVRCSLSWWDLLLQEQPKTGTTAPLRSNWKKVADKVFLLKKMLFGNVCCLYFGYSKFHLFLSLQNLFSNLTRQSSCVAEKGAPIASFGMRSVKSHNCFCLQNLFGNDTYHHFSLHPR